MLDSSLEAISIVSLFSLFVVQLSSLVTNYFFLLLIFPSVEQKSHRRDTDLLNITPRIAFL